MGIIPNAMNPIRLEPQWTPRLSKSCFANNGKEAAKTDLRNVFAAIAEAAYLVKASTK